MGELLVGHLLAISSPACPCARRICCASIPGPETLCRGERGNPRRVSAKRTLSRNLRNFDQRLLQTSAALARWRERVVIAAASPKTEILASLREAKCRNPSKTRPLL